MTLLAGEVQKVPAAKLDYRFTWSTHLPPSVTIASASWTAPSGITLVSQSNTTTTTTVRLSGGTVDTEYNIACHIVRSDGQERTRYLKVKVVAQILAYEIEKAPDDVVSFSVDWSGAIASDPIATHAWTAPGLTIVGSAASATVTVDLGTAGGDYAAVDHITTTSGQEDERVVLVHVRSL